MISFNLQFRAHVLLKRIANQLTKSFLQLATEFSYATLELVFVHWNFQEVKWAGYGFRQMMSVRPNTIAFHLE